MAVSSQNYQKNYKKSLHLYWTILTSENQTEMLLWLLSNDFLSVVPFLERQKQLCLWAEVIPRTGMGTEKALHPHLDLCRHPFLRTCHVVPQDSEVANQINSQFSLLVFDNQNCRITTYCVWRYVIGNVICWTKDRFWASGPDGLLYPNPPKDPQGQSRNTSHPLCDVFLRIS